MRSAVQSIECETASLGTFRERAGTVSFLRRPVTTQPLGRPFTGSMFANRCFSTSRANTQSVLANGAKDRPHKHSRVAPFGASEWTLMSRAATGRPELGPLRQQHTSILGSLLASGRTGFL